MMQKKPITQLLLITVKLYRSRRWKTNYQITFCIKKEPVSKHIAWQDPNGVRWIKKSGGFLKNEKKSKHVETKYG